MRVPVQSHRPAADLQCRLSLASAETAGGCGVPPTSPWPLHSWVLGWVGQGARVNLGDIPWSTQSLEWSGNPLCWQHGHKPCGSPEVEEFSCQHLVLCGHAGSGFGLWLWRFGVCVGLCIPSWRWSRCWCREGSPGLGWCRALEHLEVQRVAFFFFFFKF